MISIASSEGLRFWYKDEPPSGFDRDSQRIAKTDSGYKLLDDGGFQRGIGAFRDKGSIHDEGKVQVLKKSQGGRRTRADRALALARWIAMMLPPVVHQPLPIKTIASGR